MTAEPALPMSELEASETQLQDARTGLQRALGEEEYHSMVRQMYQGMLGFYQTQMVDMRWGKQELVRYANQTVASLTPDVPSLDHHVAAKLGLLGVPGINVQQRARHDSRTQGTQGSRTHDSRTHDSRTYGGARRGEEADRAPRRDDHLNTWLGKHTRSDRPAPRFTPKRFGPNE